MSINQDSHASLATLLYPPGTDGRGPDETESHLLDYLEHDYPHAESGDVSTTQHARTDQAPLAPLPGERQPLSGVSSPSQVAPSNRAHQPSFTAYQPGEITRSVRSGRSTSPLNPTIPIPTSLARLASETISNLSLPDPSVLSGQDMIEQAALMNDQIDRGEMGGKRRKLPHERAGWVEMDQQQLRPNGGGNGVKRRRNRKTDTSINDEIAQAQAHVLAVAQEPNQSNLRNDKPPSAGGNDDPATGRYDNEFRQLTELSQSISTSDIDKTFDSLAASSSKDGTKEDSSAPIIDPALAGEAPGEGATKQALEQAARESSPSKLSRAEQNKRAQQAFRRRREEHMKKLEQDSAQLGLVKRQMEQKDGILRDLVLALESSKIEIAALRSSIQFLIPHSSVFPLTEQGTLNLGEEVNINNDTPVSEEEVLNAFELLEKQAREVAKQNHARRE
ncbi:hypothetical protein I302_105708 [Kwoniella bestiolae CBS 10118]|uniref:BZIP domain-containing protein n=1 Tax=Kwoniella bestiolae CBS 10118 TaxID=1296100 RepID=A0A1B9G1Z7_9TREE|nr:hypothetical protein I302_04828 [Kwoniella bestiolae CBS 10118]OCF25018.1 hypothetical protein I302_04828 [Kwoniella bestiolae CBS 10118]